MSNQRSEAEIRCPTCNRWHLPVIAAGPTAGVGMVCLDCERAADSRKAFNAIMEHEVVGAPFQSAEGVWLIIDDNHIRAASGPEVKMAAELAAAQANVTAWRTKSETYNRWVGRLQSAARAAIEHHERCGFVGEVEINALKRAIDAR